MLGGRQSAGLVRMRDARRRGGARTARRDRSGSVSVRTACGQPDVEQRCADAQDRDRRDDQDRRQRVADQPGSLAGAARVAGRDGRGDRRRASAASGNARTARTAAPRRGGQPAPAHAGQATASTTHQIRPTAAAATPAAIRTRDRPRGPRDGRRPAGASPRGPRGWTRSAAAAGRGGGSATPPSPRTGMPQRDGVVDAAQLLDRAAGPACRAARSAGHAVRHVRGRALRLAGDGHEADVERVGVDRRSGRGRPRSRTAIDLAVVLDRRSSALPVARTRAGSGGRRAAGGARPRTRSSASIRPETRDVAGLARPGRSRRAAGHGHHRRRREDPPDPGVVADASGAGSSRSRAARGRPGRGPWEARRDDSGRRPATRSGAAERGESIARRNLLDAWALM